MEKLVKNREGEDYTIFIEGGYFTRFSAVLSSSAAHKVLARMVSVVSSVCGSFMLHPDFAALITTIAHRRIGGCADLENPRLLFPPLTVLAKHRCLRLSSCSSSH
jgi:hypothetical protein